MSPRRLRSGKVKVRKDGGGTEVINLRDASGVVVVEIVIHDGAVAPWHTHPGPGFLVNTGPGTLTSITADDCLPREVPAGAAVVDPGMGTLHAAFNDSGQDLVVYAVFLGVANGPVIPADPPADCDPFSFSS